jgi:hypothetical protein
MSAFADEGDSQSLVRTIAEAAGDQVVEVNERVTGLGASVARASAVEVAHVDGAGLRCDTPTPSASVPQRSRKPSQSESSGTSRLVTLCTAIPSHGGRP